MSQVHPVDKFDRQFIRDLGAQPRLLVIWHPIYRLWQVYEKPVGSDWTAERLYCSVINEHEHSGQPDHERWMWWNSPGAPYVLDDSLDVTPGSWVIAWANERESRRQNISPSQWWNKMEDARFRRELDSMKRVHDLNMAVAKDSYRHTRDIVRGDPLAGHRKWVVSKPREVGK